MREIAIRGFINEKFNTTFGKGLFRRAVFNCTIELRNPYQKFLADFYKYDAWEAQGKNDSQIEIINQLRGANIHNAEGCLVSWLQHYDPLSKHKSVVEGYSIYLPDTRELYIKINAPEFQTVEDWHLTVNSCKVTGTNKPIFIATNTDLNTFV